MSPSNPLDSCSHSAPLECVSVILPTTRHLSLPCPPLPAPPPTSPSLSLFLTLFTTKLTHTLSQTTVMPALTFHVVDAFTRTAFRGNPAAVMIFSDTEEDEKLSKDDELMQNIAAEVRAAPFEPFRRRADR